MRRALFASLALTLALVGCATQPALASTVGALPLADPSWFDGYTLHAVTGSTLAATAAAVPKGTVAKLRDRIKGLLGKADATDAEIEAALAGEIEEADAPSPTPAPTDAGGIAAAIREAVAAAVAPLQAELATVKGALESEATARQTAQQAVEAQRATERTKAITDALDAAVKDGRIVPAKRDDWQKRLEADFDTVTAILGELPTNPALAKANGATKPADGKTPDAASTATERPAPGSMAGSLPAAALAYVTNNAN